jgi:hypothetical protein
LLVVGSKYLQTIFVVAVGILVLTGSADAQGRAETPRLQGTWRMVEIDTGGAKPAVNRAPQPAVYIFTAKHYSLVREDLPRKDPADPNTPTLADLRNRLDFSAQSGTWTISPAGELTVRRIVALGLSNMQPGNFTNYAFQITGDTLLTLTPKASQAGAADPITYKLKRIE